MIKTFVLVASLWNPVADRTDVYVLDYAMNGPDCIAALSSAFDAPAIELEPGKPVDPANVVLACEIDMAEGN